MSVTLSHAGLPTTMRPFSLLDMVAKLRKSLRLRDEDIAYLRYIATFLRAEDFQVGRICATWVSAGKLADELHVSRRQLARIEKRLEDRGLIRRTWPRKGHRFGQRDSSGKIVFAGGVNLAPLVDRVTELLEALRVAEDEGRRLKDARQKANELIRAIRSLGDPEALEAARTIFPRLRPSEIGDLGRLAEVLDALSAVLADFSPKPCRTETTAVSDSKYRPNTKREKKTKTCTGSREKSRSRMQTSPAQVVALASPRFREIIHLYQVGLQGGSRSSPDWECVCLAAKELALQHGVSQMDWHSFSDAIGVERAAMAVTVVDRNHERQGRWHVQSVVGALRGIVRAEAIGNAVLESLVGEAMRSISKGDATGEEKQTRPASGGRLHVQVATKRDGGVTACGSRHTATNPRLRSIKNIGTPEGAGHVTPLARTVCGKLGGADV